MNDLNAVKSNSKCCVAASERRHHTFIIRWSTRTTHSWNIGSSLFRIVARRAVSDRHIRWNQFALKLVLVVSGSRCLPSVGIFFKNKSAVCGACTRQKQLLGKEEVSTAVFTKNVCINLHALKSILPSLHYGVAFIWNILLWIASGTLVGIFTIHIYV